MESILSHNIVTLRNYIEHTTGITFFQFINWLHLLIFSPIIFIIAYMGQHTPKYIYWILTFIIIWTLIYHFAAWFAPDKRTWIIILHIAIITPILIYFTFWQHQLSTSTFDILIALTGATVFYHTYSLIRY